MYKHYNTCYNKNVVLRKYLHVINNRKRGIKMKLSFDYKGIKVTYYLTYKKAKAISIQVTEEGRVNVTAPRGTPVFAVMDKVKGNAPWIIRELHGKVEAKNEVELLEQYTYLGKNYKLEIVLNPEAENTKVKMVRGKFVVETATESPINIRAAIVEWYKQKVAAKIKERFKEYNSLFDKVPNNIKMVDEQNILFHGNVEGIVANVKLGILPVEVIDYVLVSGLCRLNCVDAHSEKQKLEEILPNYQKSAEWLEENKNHLAL